MPVILPDNLMQQPEPHEIEVARILSAHFKMDVEFLAVRPGYKQKTPDIKMRGVLWEIKSPKGKPKTTIDKQIKDAVKQSDSIVIDGSRTRLTDKIVVQKLFKEILLHSKIKRMLYVDKHEEAYKLR